MAGGVATTQIKKALRNLGFELKRYDPEGSFVKRRQRLIEAERIDTVVDVGAHAGEFGQALRHGSYSGKIVSFEPLDEQHRKLEAVADDDGRWTCKRTAIGNSRGKVDIHISGNDGFSSSIRTMASAHELAAPSSTYISSETVEIATLDEAIVELVDDADRLLLKVDVQGYEAEVLEGAESTLPRCRLIELELGLTELYEGQALFADLSRQMVEAGFVLADIEPGFRDPRTSELLQVDGLFIRSEL